MTPSLHKLSGKLAANRTRQHMRRADPVVAERLGLDHRQLSDMRPPVWHVRRVADDPSQSRSSSLGRYPRRRQRARRKSTSLTQKPKQHMTGPN